MMYTKCYQVLKVE